MKWTRSAAANLAALALFALSATGAAAQADHLKCYKVKDPQAKNTYTADLGGLVAEPGCVIKVPAKMACVPSTKTNVNPAPPGGGATGTPNAFVCYKVKCPKGTLPPLPVSDQFGTRNLQPSQAKLLCAPTAGSTTTTTSSPTSTTLSIPPSCMNLLLDPLETDVDCGGPICPKCAAGKTCAGNSDCVSGNCMGSVCQP